MSISTGRYAIVQESGYLQMYLDSKDPGGFVNIFVKYPPPEEEMTQWDVQVIEDVEANYYTMRNVWAKLYIGLDGNKKIVATSEPYKWVMKTWGQGYVIFVPWDNLVIDMDWDSNPCTAVIQPLKILSSNNEWSFAKIQKA